jgi:putative nucleotidyltransferase with HDIG domain
VVKIFSGNIRLKLALFISALLLAITVIFSFITMQMMDRHIRSEIIKRAVSLNKSTSSLAAYSILSQDLLGLDNIVAKVKATNPDIEYAAIGGPDRRIIAHSTLEQRGAVLKPAGNGVTLLKERDGTVVSEISGASGKCFYVVTPISFSGRQIGVAATSISTSVLHAAQRDVRRKIAAGVAVSLLLGIIGIFKLTSVFTKPIEELSFGVEELKKGARGKPLRVYSNDELGQLTGSFNEMTALITEQQDKLGRYARDLEEAYVSTVRVLAAAIDARDPYTHGHSTRVASLAVRMAEELGLAEDELETLEIAALFHDIGKLKTPDGILLKEGAHDSEEYREMMRHPEDGADILRRAPSLHKYIPAVRHHHEWYDGNGYPDRLQGQDIPLFAAIVAIADAFDAMTSSRPYRGELSKDHAIEEIALNAGRQFDPTLVEVFLRVINAGPVSEDKPGPTGKLHE